MPALGQILNADNMGNGEGVRYSSDLSSKMIANDQNDRNTYVEDICGYSPCILSFVILYS